MNKNILKIHQGVLDKEREALLDRLYPYAKDYILGGGTALALQMNHRKSFDFDFFSSNPIPKNLLEKISKTIPIGNISVDTSDELTFFTANKIKVTFLYYPFNNSFPAEMLESGLKAFGIKDIAVKKHNYEHYEADVFFTNRYLSDWITFLSIDPPDFFC